MRVFIHECRTESIKFFEHFYRINPRSIHREERLQMRLENLSSWGPSILPWCGYADDLILFLLNKADLQKATNMLDQVFTRFGLNINVQKTESMILNYPKKEYPESIVSLRDTALNNVDKIKYLGAFIRCDQPNTGDAEINYRIQMAMSKFVEMSNLLQNIKINLRTRITFFNSFVRSRLIYSCQNWNLGVNQLERLNVTYRNFLRRMIRGGFSHVDEQRNDYRYRINNEKLHNICGTDELSIFIKKQQVNYSKHVTRMPQSRSLKMLMFNSDKYTKRGRPSKTLLEQVVENNTTTLDMLCNQAMMRK